MKPRGRLPEKEFIILNAMMFASIAYAIDAMLPALTQIGQELSPQDPERATLIVGTFLIGMGIGTFFSGPLSDALGRKPVILGGYVLFCIGALISAYTDSLQWVLIGRFIQGIAIAGPRISAQAMIRDLYSGERMAAISSYAMMVFALVPAVAPLIGQIIMNAFGWHSIFLSFAVFAVAIALWLALRQPETLAPEKRVTVSAKQLKTALTECMSNRVFRLSLMALTVSFAGLFAYVSAIQPIYAQTFGAVETFPYFMAATALMAMPANFTNARIVARFGMRTLVKFGLMAQMLLTCLGLILWTSGLMSLAIFFLWSTLFIFMIGFIFGNLMALALEPMGHIAGLAASVNGAFSTIGASLLAIPVGLLFDGTPMSLLIGALAFSSVGYLVMLRLGPRPSPQTS